MYTTAKEELIVKELMLPIKFNEYFKYQNLESRFDTIFGNKYRELNMINQNVNMDVNKLRIPQRFFLDF